MQQFVNEITQIFDREIEVLSGIEELQQGVESAVYAKKWTDFEGGQRMLNELSARLETLEEQRLTLFEEGSGASISENFYLWAQTLDKPDRDHIMERYQLLKNKTAKIKTAGTAFTGYLNEMQLVVTGFLDAAFPERRTGLYGREGAVRTVDMRRMVLDKQF